jgi:hypothetical protein
LDLWVGPGRAVAQIGANEFFDVRKLDRIGVWALVR